MYVEDRASVSLKESTQLTKGATIRVGEGAAMIAKGSQTISGDGTGRLMNDGNMTLEDEVVDHTYSTHGTGSKVVVDVEMINVGVMNVSVREAEFKSHVNSTGLFAICESKMARVTS